MTMNPSLNKAQHWLSSIIFAIAMGVGLVALNDIFMQPDLRARIDATKSRSYSLSPRTQQLLETLEGPWSITVVMVDSDTDPAVVRQIDEVLDRYAEAAPDMKVRRIDPSQAGALTEYDQLLLQLRERESESIVAFEDSVATALEAFSNLVEFAGPTADWIDRLLARQGGEDASVREVEAIASALRLLGRQGHLVLDAVAKSMALDDGAPLPDLETARAILEQGLTRWSMELQAASRRLDRMDNLPTEQSPEFARLSTALTSEASVLALAADRLARLQPLELARIAGRLREGEAAIIVGPDRAMAIPASQLFATNLRQDQIGSVRMDQRFRGEQLLSSAIQSMQQETMPTVVFVHADEVSRLDAHPQQADVTGIATLLEAARIDVSQWPVSLAPQPAFPAGTPVVWVVLAPSERIGFEIGSAEKRLLEATSHLLDQGASVLLSLYPSFLPRYGQPDPWASLAAELGLEADTGAVLLQEAVDVDGDVVVQMFQQLTEFPPPHPVAGALNGQSLALPLPVPLQPLDGAAGNFHVLATIEPDADRWLETQWTPTLDLGPVRRGDQQLPGPVNVIYAVERDIESHSSQRVMVVGSGPWMLTNVADVAVSAGGDRISLLHPGNHELMMSSVAWLAGKDQLVAQGPLSQEVARLRGIGNTELQVVGWLLMLVLPGIVLLLGVGVWMARRT